MRDSTLPPRKWQKSISSEEAQKKYRWDVDIESLQRCFEDGIAPYLEQPFRADFVEAIYKEYGYLGWPGLLGPIQYRAW